MYLEQHPKELYPNTVAGAMIDLVSNAPEGFAVGFFEQDLIVTPDTILASERVQDRPIALFNVSWVDTLTVNPRFQRDSVRVKVRMANHNPDNMEVQQQEATVLAYRVKSRLQGQEITPQGCSPGVVQITSPIEEEINEPQLSVYYFNAEVTLTHEPL